MKLYQIVSVSKTYDTSSQEAFNKDFVNINMFPFDYSETENAKLNEFLRSELGNAYHAPTAEEKEARRQLVTDAKAKVKSVLFTMASSQAGDIGMGDDDRSVQALFKSGEGAKAENEEILRVLKSGTRDEKRELMFNIIDRLTVMNPGTVEQYSDRELVEKLDTLIPVANMAMELKKIDHLFKDVWNSPEEKKQFDEILSVSMDAGYDVFNRVDFVLDPMYEDVDLQQLPADPVFSSKLSEKLESGEFSTLQPKAMELTTWLAEKAAVPRKQIAETMLKSGQISRIDKNLRISPEPDGKKAKSKRAKNATYENGGDFLEDLKNGKPVFVKADEEGGEIKAFRDLNGNGLITEVPIPPKNPNIFAWAVDWIMRKLGYDGLESCQKVRDYESRIDELREEVADKDRFDKYREAKTELSKAKQKDAVQKADLTKMVSRAEDTRAEIQRIEETSRQILHEFYGPGAKEDNFVRDTLHSYGQEAFSPEPLPAPENTPFTEHEIDLIYAAGVTDPEIFDGVKKAEGCSSSEMAHLKFSSTTYDFLYNQRSNVTSGIEHINPGRRKGADNLKAYMSGNPEPLAKSLGNNLKNYLSFMHGETEFNEKKYGELLAAKDILGLLRKDPKLMGASGITKDDVEMLRGMDSHCELWKESVEAGGRLAEAALGKRTLTQEEKERDLLSLLAYEHVCAGNKAAHDLLVKSPESQKLLADQVTISMDQKAKNDAYSAALKNNAPEEELAALKEASDNALLKREHVFNSFQVIGQSYEPTSLFKKLGEGANPQGVRDSLKKALASSAAFQNLKNLPEAEYRRFLADPNQRVNLQSELVLDFKEGGRKPEVREDVIDTSKKIDLVNSI